ncbi:putative leucine-rich repeat receptor-like protein kinase At2g19210 isoform X2 [Magnolia sinica]|uniref:putative leucine-rich repeat receptor-like protein kinase At2g19210 isoform X2 n=1 Tax=Magnolia sinica TaxID=86752 RepID=UPI0026589501|nr:putative leucine-rich repeat receptor-like protein kinase At2g19210 isoform X2 [Magnolia sinica]
MMLWFYFVWYLWSSAVHVHGQSGFISIDCGIPENSPYIDKVTHISYFSDAEFIDSGMNSNISDLMTNDVPDQFSNVRYFPNGTRNCYTLKNLNKGSKYLIRASFMYGNYDGKNQVPEFKLYLGANLWDKAHLENASHILRMEIIVVASLDFVSVCLENIDRGIPFISVLELRFLPDEIYSADMGSEAMVNESQSLLLFDRRDLGSTNGQEIRYAIDVFDRIWSAESLEGSEPFASPTIIKNNSEGFQPPSAVVRTAVRPLNGGDVIYFNWTVSDPGLQFHVFMHFAEIEKVEKNQWREFNVCCSVCYKSNYRPSFLTALTVYTAHPLSGHHHYSCSVRKTAASTLPPILNAIEVYTVRKLSEISTAIQDVEAMMNVKERYRVKRKWMADPCVPTHYMWEGLNCSYNGSNPYRIASLDLASSGLSGEIADSLAELTSIRRLDLSSNNLTGPIPDFLADLPLLEYLDLSSNKLTGSIPIRLLQKSRKRLLTLSVDDNPNLCLSESCQTKGRNLILITAVVPSVVAVLLIAVIIIWRFIERRRRAMEPHNEEVSLVLDSRHFTYAEVVSMTNDFQRVIGKGAFGTVYHGYMRDGAQVAVKMLSQTSSQGSNGFRTEAHLLMRVHHRNLASFMGYCDEGSNMALIYEYMAEGNLAEHLSERNARVLSWEERLRIALDAAQDEIELQDWSICTLVASHQ